jgi:hypothetical protein
MCCLLTMLVLVGPRITILIWWPLNMNRWEAAFDSFWLPFLGFLIAPWTTLMYVGVAPTGSIDGADWFFLGIAILADVASYSGGAYGNRDRFPTYAR